MIKILLSLLAILLMVTTASATDYYVSTTGNNSALGDLTHPWQNLTYADGQLSAGDTLYLFDGTWIDELFVFHGSGSSGNPITVTSYNGTPTMDCTAPATSTNKAFVIGSYDYINISNIKITDYYRAVESTSSSTNIHLDNITVVYTGEQTIYFGSSVSDSSIKNCDLDGAHWNTILIGGGCSHITIDNNHIHNNYDHALIDLYGSGTIIDNITITNNLFDDTSYPAIYTHGASQGLGGKDWTIENNIGYDFTGNVIEIELKTGSIKNNTLYNITSPYAWTAYPIALTDGSDTVTMDANNISDSEDTEYRLYAGDHIVSDAIGKTFRVAISAGASAEVKFSDGKIFSENGGQNVYWYPSKSNYSCASESITVTTYNVTLKPNTGYLSSVSVNHESDTSDDSTNITVSSSVSTNPTWINATMQNAAATYNVSVDGVNTAQVQSGEDKIARYQYTDSWSPHTFEFTWSSGGGAAPGACNVVWIETDIDIPINEMVQVPISIENATGIAGVSLSVSYNSSVIEITGGLIGNFTWNYSLNCDDTVNGTATVYTVIGAQNLTGNLTIGTINVTAVGSSGETSNLTIGNVILCDDYGTYIIPDAVVNGSVILSGTLPGDADSNGVVNTLDVLLIMQYLMYPATTTIDEDAADVCGNLGVDIADATLILSHCVNPSKYPLE